MGESECACSASARGDLLSIDEQIALQRNELAALVAHDWGGALAWGLSLFFMPYLTLLPYLIFGRSTFDAYIQARRQANQEMHTAINELNWRPWLEEALAALDKDRDFLTQGGVFSNDWIDAYLALKMEEVNKVRMTTHPVEFDLYYSC